MVMLPLHPALRHVQVPPQNHQETVQKCAREKMPLMREQVTLNSRDDSALFVVSPHS